MYMYILYKYLHLKSEQTQATVALFINKINIKGL